MNPNQPDVSKAHAQVMEAMKGDLLIIFLEKLGGKLDLSLADVDNLPVGKGLAFSLDSNTKMFHFEVVEAGTKIKR